MSRKLKNNELVLADYSSNSRGDIRWWQLHRRIFYWFWLNFYWIPHLAYRNGKAAKLKWWEIHWWWYLYFWQHTVWRYRQMAKCGDGGWFWVGAVSFVAALFLVAVAIHGGGPRAKLTAELLNLAEQYHADYADVVAGGFGGTVTLTVDILRASGYDVRRFEKHNCHGRDTHILIRADGEGNYKVRGFNLSCEGF